MGVNVPLCVRLLCSVNVIQHGIDKFTYYNDSPKWLAWHKVWRVYGATTARYKVPQNHEATGSSQHEVL